MNREQIKAELTKLELTFGLVMERVKTALELGTDAELAALMGMSTSNYANRKRAESIPFDLVIPLCLSRFVSIDWVCTGVGHPFRTGEMSTSVPAPVAIKPELLAKVLRELELASGGLDSGKLGFFAGVVYNKIAGERNEPAQAAQLRDAAQLLAAVDKLADPAAIASGGPGKGPARPRRRRS